MLSKEFKEEWVAALRSDDYKQGAGELKNRNNEYCCLGVACDLLVKKGLAIKNFSRNGLTTFDLVNGNSPEWCILPKSVSDYLGIDKDPMVRVSDEKYETLSELNDAGRSFKALASLIEAQL